MQAEFEDTGVGIAADVFNRLFEPFVTTKPEGLGMGLSICRTLIEQHGGDASGGQQFGRGSDVLADAPAARMVRIESRREDAAVV